MTTFLDLAKERYSVRSFSPREIEPEKLTQVLEAARLAPTAKNNQPQRIKIITGADGLAKVDECTPCRFDAQTMLLVCYDKTVCSVRQFDDAMSGEIDAAIVTTHIMLAARDLGLGTCWVMRFDPAKTRELFELPENIVPVAMMPIGYLAEDAAPSDRHTDRMAVEEIVF